MIADRLSGIDVCSLGITPEGGVRIHEENGAPVRVKAEEPTLEALLALVRESVEWVKMRLEDQKRRQAEPKKDAAMESARTGIA